MFSARAHKKINRLKWAKVHSVLPGSITEVKFVHPSFANYGTGSMVFSRSLNKGFSLIELMVVMAILGVLAAVVVTSYPGARRSSRDTQRMSDLKQYQAALEIYANANNGTYPNFNGALDDMCIAGTISLGNCPVGPDGNSYMYRGTNLRYHIYTRLELEDHGATQWFVACSDGRSDTATSDPSGAGSCPL